MDSSAWLVAAQGTALAGVAWPAKPRWRLGTAGTAASATAIAAGAGLALAGARPHGRRLSPFVEPPPGGALITAGAYRFSRHPIYVGLLTAAAGLAVLRRHPRPLLAWAGLAAVLAAKTRLEEQRLASRFGARWGRYAARTPRVLGRPPRPRGRHAAAPAVVPAVAPAAVVD